MGAAYGWIEDEFPREGLFVEFPFPPRLRWIGIRFSQLRAVVAVVIDGVVAFSGLLPGAPGPLDPAQRVIPAPQIPVTDDDLVRAMAAVVSLAQEFGNDFVTDPVDKCGYVSS